MDAQTACCNLLEALAGRLGMDTLTPDAEGRISLRLGSHATRLAFSAELEELFSLIRIAPLPAKKRSEAIKSLSCGNYAWSGTGGGILSLDEGGWVCLARRYPLDRAEPGNFLEELAGQLALADFWLDALEGRRELP
jgi:hypothetical protein